MTDSEGDLLVLLVDLALLLTGAVQDAAPEELLSQLLAFTNAYTMLSSHNRLAVFAGKHMCHLVHLGLGEAAGGDSAAVFPSGSLHSHLSELVRRCAPTEGTAGRAAPTPGFALSGALSRALCLIHRLQHTARGGAAAAAGDTSGSGAASGAAGPGRGRGRPRLLVLTASPDVPSQYIPVMNAIFSAQRAQVVIDAVVLAPEDSSFLQQAAHLTGGLYFRPGSGKGLLGYLLNHFSCDTTTRGHLDETQQLGVDFRASCFCHKYVIETGYVCSVCLSIFCQPSRECSTCGTQFTTGGAGAAGRDETEREGFPR